MAEKKNHRDTMEIECFVFVVDLTFERVLSYCRQSFGEKFAILQTFSHQLVDFSPSHPEMGQVVGRRRRRQSLQEVNRQLQLQLEEKERMNTLLAGSLGSLSITNKRMKKELEEAERAQLKCEQNLASQLHHAREEALISKDKLFRSENEWRAKFARCNRQFDEELESKQRELDAALEELAVVKQQLKELEKKQSACVPVAEDSKLLSIIKTANKDQQRSKNVHIKEAGSGIALTCTTTTNCKEAAFGGNGTYWSLDGVAFNKPSPIDAEKKASGISAAVVESVLATPAHGTIQSVPIKEDTPAVTQSKSFMSWITHDIEKIIDDDNDGDEQESHNQQVDKEDDKISIEEIEACSFASEDEAKNYMEQLFYRHQKEVLAVVMEKGVIQYRYDWLQKQLLYLGERHGLMMASKQILELESIMDDLNRHNEYLERQNWYLERENCSLKSQLDVSLTEMCEVHGILE